MLFCIVIQVDLNPNGTVKYCDFIDKYYKGSNRKGGNMWTSGTHRYN